MTSEEAIHILDNLKPTNTKSSFDAYVVGKAITMAIKALEQEPKTGRWIYTGDYITDGMLKCSECGFEHDVSERFLYCPYCGAKMEG